VTVGLLVVVVRTSLPTKNPSSHRLLGTLDCSHIAVCSSLSSFTAAFHAPFQSLPWPSEISSRNCSRSPNLLWSVDGWPRSFPSSTIPSSPSAAATLPGPTFHAGTVCVLRRLTPHRRTNISDCFPFQSYAGIPQSKHAP
jgi:hypothetical protein